MAFLRGVKSDWERSTARLDDTPAVVATCVRTRDGTPQRDFVTNPATFADVYAYTLSAADPFLRGTGKTPFAHVEPTFNAFTSYRFANDAPRLARGVRAGLGANHRGPAVIGYDAANGNSVISGHSAITWSGMLGKRFALRRGQSLDLQLNVEKHLRSGRSSPAFRHRPRCHSSLPAAAGSALVDVARDVWILKTPPGSAPDSFQLFSRRPRLELAGYLSEAPKFFSTRRGGRFKDRLP